MLLLMIRGTPFLYYGDEIGMDAPEIVYEDLKDPVGLRFWPEGKGRDACRTPMQWTAEPGRASPNRASTPGCPSAINGERTCPLRGTIGPRCCG